MPEGIESEVSEGFARVTFTDPSLRGAALARLLDLVGPDFVDVDTSGVRRSYRVPESAARAAGLLDEPEQPAPARKTPARKTPARKTPARKTPASRTPVSPSLASNPFGSTSGDTWP